MKFLHTSDLHIGKIVNGFSMLEEQKHVLRQITEAAKTRQVDAVFLSGDLYDRQIPPAQAVGVLDDFLTELNELGILVFAIAGNHDSGERIGFAGRILRKKGLHMEGTLQNPVGWIDMETKEGPVRIHLIPYAKPAEVRAMFGCEAVTYEESMLQILKTVEYKENGSNVLLAHQFVVNRGQEPELSDSETRVSVGGVDQVEAANFRRFDYVALGHIHGCQQMGDGPVYYCGSPVKYSFSEVHHEKAVLYGELCEGKPVQMEKLLLTPIHDMRKIRGRLAELISPQVAEAADPEDYLLAVLTNEEELIDPIGTLRSVYPNVMQLQIERAVRSGQEPQRHAAEMKEKSPYQLFEDFFEQVMGKSLGDEQKEAVQNVIEAAGEEMR